MKNLKFLINFFPPLSKRPCLSILLKMETMPMPNSQKTEVSWSIIPNKEEMLLPWIISFIGTVDLINWLFNSRFIVWPNSAPSLTLIQTIMKWSSSCHVSHNEPLCTTHPQLCSLNYINFHGVWGETGPDCVLFYFIINLLDYITLYIEMNKPI